MAMFLVTAFFVSFHVDLQPALTDCALPKTIPTIQMSSHNSDFSIKRDEKKGEKRGAGCHRKEILGKEFSPFLTK